VQIVFKFKDEDEPKIESEKGSEYPESLVSELNLFR